MVAALLWYAAALAACLAVLAVNREPLFYFDTFGYLSKGYKSLAMLGLGLPQAGGGGTGGGGGGARAVADVDGTHSVVYSLFLALLARARLLEGMVLVNAGLVLVTGWLVARVLRRDYALSLPLPMLVALPVIAAATTALPFYVAYIMPDIFTPVLIVMIALLSVFVHRMHRGEILLALGLGWVAALAHLSHPGIALLMVPLSALSALLVSRRRWWVAPLLVASFVAVPLAEKEAFKVSVETVSRAEVSYKPFLTARLIQDGPGFDYLAAHCPDPAIATCALWRALQGSDDPYRLTASHIIFERSAQLGSFLHMPPEEQRRVSAEQFDFFFKVLADRPVATTLAFIRNALLQARMVEIDMTLPGKGTREKMADWNQMVPESPVALGRLSPEGAWQGGLERLHLAIYGLSALLIVGGALGIGGLPVSVRLLLALVLAGILANALVCGGVSQPATRYGARVAWLLPQFAALMLLVRLGLPSGRRRRTAG
jgi:hypothetical protein